MSTDQPGQGRRGVLLTALAVLAVLVGVVVIAVGVATQRPDPPSPPAATSAAEPTEATGGPEDEQPDEAGSDGAADDGQSATTGPGSSAQDEGQDGQETEQPAEPEVAALDPSEPVEVRIPSIDVVSPLHPLGLAEDGTLQVPSGDRYDEAAWYDGSPTPGEVGPTVIEGHVTGAGGVESVFFDLGSLRAGDTAEVEREDGRTVTFEVYRVDQFAKDAFPTVDVYGPTDSPELRLITCGGEFDEAEQSHEDNTVVYARMVEG